MESPEPTSKRVTAGIRVASGFRSCLSCPTSGGGALVGGGGGCCGVGLCVLVCFCCVAFGCVVLVLFFVWWFGVVCVGVFLFGFVGCLFWVLGVGLS